MNTSLWGSISLKSGPVDYISSRVKSSVGRSVETRRFLEVNLIVNFARVKSQDSTLFQFPKELFVAHRSGFNSWVCYYICSFDMSILQHRVKETDDHRSGSLTHLCYIQSDFDIDVRQQIVLLLIAVGFIQLSSMICSCVMDLYVLLQNFGPLNWCLDSRSLNFRFTGQELILAVFVASRCGFYMMFCYKFLSFSPSHLFEVPDIWFWGRFARVSFDIHWDYQPQFQSSGRGTRWKISWSTKFHHRGTRLIVKNMVRRWGSVRYGSRSPPHGIVDRGIRSFVGATFDFPIQDLFIDLLEWSHTWVETLQCVLRATISSLFKSVLLCDVLKP